MEPRRRGDNNICRLAYSLEYTDIPKVFSHHMTKVVVALL
jgi:hypothetical protein